MTIEELKRDQKAKIKEILGGWGLKRRLISLGIDIGDEIKIITGDEGWGPILIEDITKGTKVAIGRGMARKIIVEL